MKNGMTKKQAKQRKAELKKTIAATKKDIKKDTKKFNAAAKKVIDTAHECGNAQEKYAVKQSSKNSKKLTLAQTQIAAQYKDYAAAGNQLASNIATVDASYAELATLNKGRKANKIVTERSAYVAECHSAVADVQQEVSKMVAVKSADGTIQQPVAFTASTLAAASAAPVLPTRTVTEIEESLKAAKKALKDQLKRYQACEANVLAAVEAYKKAQAAYTNKANNGNAKKLAAAKTDLSVEYKEYVALKDKTAATLAVAEADYKDLVALTKVSKQAKVASEAEAYTAECKAIVGAVDANIAANVVVRASV